MTQVLLPSSVGSLNSRLWPTKVQFKHEGKDLYHLRESSRQLRLLHQDLFIQVNGCHGEKQIKNFVKLDAPDEKKNDLTQLLNVAVTMKQDAKQCTRVNNSSNESTRRFTRYTCSSDEKPGSVNTNVADQQSAVDLQAIEIKKEHCSSSYTNGGQQTVKTFTNRSVKRRSENVIRHERDNCESIEKRLTRQAIRREQQPDVANKESIKKGSTEKALNPMKKKLPCSTKTLEVVAVPTWRTIHILKLYKLENTENLTDESYLKRHQRLEADEKRRKRWDLQRQRELSAYESARVGCSEASNPSPPSPSLSDTIEVAYVEVRDDTSISDDPPRPKLGRKKLARSLSVEHNNETSHRRRGRTKKTRRR